MPRKLILFIATSLDGYIADERGGVSWLSGDNGDPDPGAAYHTFLQSIDTIIMGRTTYEQLINELSPAAWPYEGIKCYVATTRKMENTSHVEPVHGNICNLADSLKHQEGKDIWLVGGVKLLNDFVKQDLIDAYQITIIPTILGKGTRLFNEPNPQINLKLDHCSEFNGMMLLEYSRRDGK